MLVFHAMLGFAPNSIYRAKLEPPVLILKSGLGFGIFPGLVSTSNFCFTALMHWRWLRDTAWLVLAFTIPVPAATYEVAQLNPQANDNGDGTRERPWKTIGFFDPPIAARTGIRHALATIASKAYFGNV